MCSLLLPCVSLPRLSSPVPASAPFPLHQRSLLGFSRRNLSIRATARCIFPDRVLLLIVPFKRSASETTTLHNPHLSLQPRFRTPKRPLASLHSPTLPLSSFPQLMPWEHNAPTKAPLVFLCAKFFLASRYLRMKVREHTSFALIDPWGMPLSRVAS